MKRFAVRIEFYIYTDTEAEAKKTAENIAEDRRYYNFDDCTVLSVTEKHNPAILKNRLRFLTQKE